MFLNGAKEASELLITQQPRQLAWTLGKIPANFVALRATVVRSVVRNPSSTTYLQVFTRGFHWTYGASCISSQVLVPRVSPQTLRPRSSGKRRRQCWHALDGSSK